MICKTVVLELHSLLLRYFKIGKSETLAVVNHLLSIPHATVDYRKAVKRILSSSKTGRILPTHCIMPAI